MHREEVAVAPATALVRPAGSGARFAKRLGIGAAVFAGMVAVLLLWPRPEARITELTYSVQAGGRLYFKGSYNGEPFRLVRAPPNGGAGTWALYSGLSTYRMRTTYMDGKGVTEVLAMDKGFRIALNYAGNKHVEYRFFGPDRRFVMGSVLYRDNGRWRQGLLKTEAFSNYAALVDVKDVTATIASQPISFMKTGVRSAFNLRSFSLISAANAQETEDKQINSALAPHEKESNKDNATLAREVVAPAIGGLPP